LDDGSTWTSKEVAKLIDCSASNAYSRLMVSTDPAYVLRPMDKAKKKDGKRVYVLDDGSEWTYEMVAVHTGCGSSTAATRLSLYTDIKRVLAPPLKRAQEEKRARIAMADRMYFDPLGHWKLLNRCM